MSPVIPADAPRATNVTAVMAAFAPYRRVLARPGAVAFSAAGLLARMPMSMASIGIVLLVQGATGNYRTAGFAAASYTLAEAVLAILQARLIDRHGQGRVLAVAGPIFGIALGLMIWAAVTHRPLGWVYALAAMGGATLPSIGSSVRARWTHLLAGSADLSTAFALEAVVDEIVFMVGPIVVTVLASVWTPAAGLATAVVACVLGTLLFAAQRETEPPVHPHHADAVRPPMPWRVVGPLGVVSLGLGVLFGATEVATVAFSAEHHHRALAGLVLAAWSIGSMLSGVVVGTLHGRAEPATRVRWGSFAMALGAVPLIFANSLPMAAAFLFVAGWGIAPTMVSSISLVQSAVPPARLTEGMALLSMGIIGGVAPGAALAGVIVDDAGAATAYWLPVAAGATAVLAAQLLPRRVPRREARRG